jgi:hypothetical protein
MVFAVEYPVAMKEYLTRVVFEGENTSAVRE